MTRILAALAALIVAIGFGPTLARMLRRKHGARRKLRPHDELRLTNL
ncbi:MAG: hypothetical protein AAGB16_08565 [Pseudomonadota bacterium]